MQRKALAFDSIIFIVAFIANVVLLNMLGTALSVRADLTRDKLFTLSPGSVNILRGLEDTLTVRVYLTRDLPPQFNSLPRNLSDKLEEYRAASNGKLEYKLVYPEDDEKLRKEAQELGVVQGQAQARAKGKIDVRKVYMGIAMFYGAQKDVLPWIPEGHQSLDAAYEFLEYNLTARIRKLSRGTTAKRKIGFLAGHDEAPIGQQGMQRLAQVLKQDDYEVVPVDTTGDKTIPADIDVLVVGGPKKKLAEREVWEIDQHLMRGRPVAFFVDAINVQPQKGMVLGSPADHGLRDLVASYGVKQKPAIVLDERSIPVPVPAHQRVGNMVIQSNVYKQYPPIPAVQGIAKHMLTRGVAEKRFVTPFTAPLELDKTALGDKLATELAWSSPVSWTMDGSFYLLNPTSDFNSPWKRILDEAIAKAERTGDESGIAAAEAKAKDELAAKGPPKNASGRPGYSLAYSVQGKFKSFFAGKPTPAGVKKEAATVAESVQPTQILVVGNSFMLQDNFFAPGNQLFVQNALDWLLSDSDLMMVRGRTSAPPPLDISEDMIEMVRIANVVGVPVVVVLVGLGRWLLRRRRKAALQRSVEE